MRDILIVVNKVLVNEYYRLNTGFFLFVITIAFGFMSGTEHKALAELFISSPFLTLIPAAAWTVYLMKIMAFNYQQSLVEKNQFITEVVFLKKSEQRITALFVLVEQFLPAIAYGVFLITIAIKNNEVFAILIVLLSLIALLGFGTLHLLRQFQHPYKEQRTGRLKHFLDKNFYKPSIQFFLEHLARKQPMALFTTKIFSGLLLYGICQLYRHDTYDIRLLAMGTTFAFAANFMLLTHLHKFENHEFQLLRNLPLSTGRRLLKYVSILAILCVPELAVLIKNFPSILALHEFIYLFTFGISIALFFYTLHFISAKLSNDLSRIIFFTIITWVLLILFRAPLPILILVNTIVSIWVTYRSYYEYEYYEQERK